MQLEDWLDDLCVRFIINLPPEELASPERICFQVEEAQWFYEDFIRPLDPSLPSLSLKSFSLRIFQHCPLFSTWSTQHYTTALAEFLAYKQRVPVRGAIMLNEEMDEVVLVKGWKKGANWSFPRGKINKDENDLDCAIREVYEETGYDIHAAGLVKSAKDVKYIEVTMREQHMRLYVFRGVPKSTHFEPKTRKEISKVEWYKLTDLPTLKKKHSHHDTQDESHIANANKFYMVAPFLHPLKKWIAQQKKRDNRFSSSHLAAPPMTMDESATEGEPGPATYPPYYPQVQSPPIPSTLPEVTFSQDQHLPRDPTSHLKELLNIGVPPRQPVPPAEPGPVAENDTTKANALLSLLRMGSTAETHPNPHAPIEQTSSRFQTQPMPQQPMGDPNHAVGSYHQPAPVMSPDNQLYYHQQPPSDPSANPNISNQAQPRTIPVALVNPEYSLRNSVLQPSAPYHRNSDPQFERESPENIRDQMVPPASTLPKLTHHTRALLDAFKLAPSPSPSAGKSQLPTSNPPSLVASQQTLLDMFKSKSPAPQANAPIVPKSEVSRPLTTPNEPSVQQEPQSQPQTGTNLRASNASTLLSLFQHPTEANVVQKAPKAKQLELPAELAASPRSSPKPQEPIPATELLSKLTRKDAPKRTPQATRAGETAATLDAPINQPHFESIAKSPSHISADSMHRSPVPSHRTLYDPKQPAPTKILQRSGEGKRGPAKSPRPNKANVAVVSPKQKTRTKSEKPFQPQILKRPQLSDNQEQFLPTPIHPTAFVAMDDVPKQPSPAPRSLTTSPLPPRQAAASPATVDTMRRPPQQQQTESQKQSLLSLLTGQSEALGTAKTPGQMPTPGPVSPLTQSQLVSPLGDEPPISTRSRIDSLASISTVGLGIENRPKMEKRQTTADDKAFLLGYLGRIASQEGHAQ